MKIFSKRLALQAIQGRVNDVFWIFFIICKQWIQAQNLLLSKTKPFTMNPTVHLRYCKDLRIAFTDGLCTQRESQWIFQCSGEPYVEQNIWPHKSGKVWGRQAGTQNNPSPYNASAYNIEGGSIITFHTQISWHIDHLGVLRDDAC